MEAGDPMCGRRSDWRESEGRGRWSQRGEKNDEEETRGGAGRDRERLHNRLARNELKEGKNGEP